MSLRTYIPSGVEAEVERVKESGSQNSPSYFTTSLTRPTALSRNLREIVATAELDFDVAPIKAPATHSSGDVSNSRSFDYDYLVSNEDNSEAPHFFIMDTGSKTWFVTFEEEVNDTFVFKVSQISENEPETDIAMLDIRAFCTSNIAVNLTSTIDSSVIEGYGIDFLSIPDVDLVATEEVIEEEIEEDMERTYKLTIETSRLLTPTEKRLLKDVDVVTAYKNEDYRSNIKFFNKLSYDRSLNDHYIYNNAQRFESLKAHLVSEKPYAAFAGKLDNETSVLFSVDVKYNDMDDLTSSIANVESVLGTTAITLAESEESLVGFQTLYYKVVDDDTSTITTVELLKTETVDNEGEEIQETSVVATQTTSTDPAVWYDFFRLAGITATIINKDVVTTTIETQEVPGATPEDPVTTEEIEVEHTEVVLKGFVLKVDRSLATETVSYKLRIKSTGESTAYIDGSENVTCLEEALVLKDSNVPSVIVYPTEKSLDGLTKVYTIGYKNTVNFLTNIFSVSLTDTAEDFSVTKSLATSLKKGEYTLSTPLEVTFEKSPFFNKGYGIKENVLSLKNYLSDTAGVAALSDPNFAELIVQVSDTSIKNLYLKTDKPNKIDTDSSHYLKTDSEILFQTDGSNPVQRSFRIVKEVPYVIVDLYSLTELEIVPYSFLNFSKKLVKEQDTAQILKTGIEPPEDSSERELLFDSLMKELMSSLVSLNALPILPLYNIDKEFAECFAIFYDPVTVEGKELSNAFVKLDSSALLEDRLSISLQYISHYNGALPVYKDLALPPSLELDSFEYFKINSTTKANLYSTDISYSLDTEYDVKIEVLDYLGAVVDTLLLVSDATSILEDQVLALNSQYLNVTLLSNSILSLTLKTDVEHPRYSVEFTNNRGGDLVSSKVAYRTEQNVVIVPLNRV